MKEMLQNKFNKLIKNCEEYAKKIVASGNKAKPNEIGEYLESQYNIISDMQKLVTQLAIDSEAREKYDKNARLDALTTEDVFKQELEAWGIVNSSFAYELVMQIAKHVKPNTEYNEVLNILANVTGKRKCNISSAFAMIVKSADFSKSKYIPMLAKLPKEKITKEYLVSQLIDFCE